MVRQDGIGILDVNNDNILVTMAEMNREAPSLIYVDFFRHVGHGNKNVVCLHVDRFLYLMIIHCYRLGTLPGLIKMAFSDGCFGTMDVFHGMVSHKARAPLEVTLLNCSEPC